MSPKTLIVGAGCTKFERPFSKEWDYPDMVKQAVSDALKDARISYSDVDAVVIGYCYGDPTSGQRAIYSLGLTGVPVFNVNNNCSTGSTALYLARTLIQAGRKCVLAVGFEKSEKGNLSQKYDDRAEPAGRHFETMFEMGASEERVSTRMNLFTENILKMFAEAAKEHQQKYGTTDAQFAKVAYKNHKHSRLNPRALMQVEIPYDKIANGRKLVGPLTSAQACPVADGAACVVVCGEAMLKGRPDLQGQAVEVLAQEIVTDFASSFDKRSYIGLSGWDMARTAAERVYTEANITPRDVDVIEVHDCFSSNELMTYEALGLCEPGGGGRLIDSGEWVKNRVGEEQCRIGGRWVVNPSGGLLSKGHPIGATGLAQCSELYWQLCGKADKRQVDDAKIGLQHNFGLNGGAVVTLYKKYHPSSRL